ncbi:MAG: hypothetical protein R2883_03895 [Caldisericia bacterium]
MITDVNLIVAAAFNHGAICIDTDRVAKVSSKTEWSQMESST